MENDGDNKCPTEVPADMWKYHLARHGWLDAGESLKINCVYQILCCQSICSIVFRGNEKAILLLQAKSTIFAMQEEDFLVQKAVTLLKGAAMDCTTILTPQDLKGLVNYFMEMMQSNKDVAERDMGNHHVE